MGGVWAEFVLPLTDVLLGHTAVSLDSCSKQPSGRMVYSLIPGAGQLLTPAATLTLEVNI